MSREDGGHAWIARFSRGDAQDSRAHACETARDDRTFAIDFNHDIADTPIMGSEFLMP